MYTLKAIPFVREHLFTFSWLKIIGIWVAFASSIVEEILFRQILMNWLMSLNYGIIIQILASAIIFVVVHGAWVFFGVEFKIVLLVFLFTLLFVVLLAVFFIFPVRIFLLPILPH